MVRRVITPEMELDILRQSWLSTPRSLLVHAIHSRGNATKEEIAASNKMSLEDLEVLLKEGKGIADTSDSFSFAHFDPNTIEDIMSQPGLHEVQFVWLVCTTNVDGENGQEDDKMEWQVLPQSLAEWFEDMMAKFMSRCQRLRKAATEQDHPAYIAISTFHPLDFSVIQNWS